MRRFNAAERKIALQPFDKLKVEGSAMNVVCSHALQADRIVRSRRFCAS
jgi:hypothetical protein